jgi:hypothetical protein
MIETGHPDHAKSGRLFRGKPRRIKQTHLPWEQSSVCQQKFFRANYSSKSTCIKKHSNRLFG